MSNQLKCIIRHIQLCGSILRERESFWVYDEQSRFENLGSPTYLMLLFLPVLSVAF